MNNAINISSEEEILSIYLHDIDTFLKHLETNRDIEKALNDLGRVVETYTHFNGLCQSDIKVTIKEFPIKKNYSDKDLKKAREALTHLENLCRMELDVKVSTENGCQGPDRGSGIICE